MLLELGESCARIPWWQDADISWPPREGKYRMKSTIFKSAVINLAPIHTFKWNMKLPKPHLKREKDIFLRLTIENFPEVIGEFPNRRRNNTILQTKQSHQTLVSWPMQYTVWRFLIISLWTCRILCECYDSVSSSIFQIVVCGPLVCCHWSMGCGQQWVWGYKRHWHCFFDFFII